MADPATAVTIHQQVERQSVTVTPMDLVERAVANGATMDVLERLMAMQERVAEREAIERPQRARRAFDEAFSLAKSKMPVIIKNRAVSYGSGNGKTSYRHEDLAEIIRSVDPVLAEFGLYCRFRTGQIDNRMSVTCIIGHRDGHYEENTLTAGYDTSGSKNPIQAIGSAQTYLQRYTLKAALGLAASNDDDAVSVSSVTVINNNEPAGYLSAEQVGALQEKIAEVGANIQKFCEYFKVDRIENIHPSQFDRAIGALAAKAKRPAAAQAGEVQQ